MKRCSAALSLFVAMAPVAHAHPGHGLVDHGALHAITSPYHLGVLALCGAGLWFGARFVQGRGPRRILQYAGLAGLLVAGVLLGMRT